MAQPSPPGHIEAHIHGDVSGQLAVGNYIVQIGEIHGGVVNVSMPERRARPRPRPPPVRLLPRPVRGLLDREAEVDAAATALQSALPVEFCGQGGMGKTTLLRYLAHHPPATALPDGIIYLPARRQPIADLLQSLFDAFYETDVPFKPTDAQLRHALQGKRALILLDDVDLARDEVEALMDAAPVCAFLLASPERRLWGEGRAMALRGLPPDDALALVERELGRPLTPEERPAAQALCTALDGHPLHILQAAAMAREERRSLADVARQVQPAAAVGGLTAQVLPSLPKPEKRAVAALAALDGAPLHGEHLAAMASLPEPVPVLKTLLRRGLVQAHSPRYSLTGTLSQDLQQRWDLSRWRERALTYFTTWVEQRRPSPDRVSEETDPILRTLEWAAGAGRWADVLRLGQAVEGALALSRRWGAWQRVLNLLLQAARGLGNRSVEAWALHQLGTRALCLGQPGPARTTLSHALRLRQALGDRAGAAVTRHNLSLLGAPPAPPRKPPTPQAGPSPVTWLALLGGFVAVVAILTGVVIGIMILPTPTPPPTWPPTSPPTLTPTSPPGVEVAFSADQTTVSYGACTTLRWTVKNARSVRLDGSSVASQGEQRVCPEGPTNAYVLTVVSGGGETVERVTTIEVAATPTPVPTDTHTPPPGVEIAFSADQTTVSYGDCTTLRWMVQNARSVRLDGSSVPGQGSQQVCPRQPTNTYVLTVVSLRGETAERVVTINVPATPTPVTPTPALPPPPTNVQASRDGEYFTVTWNASEGATYYRIVTQACSGEVWNDQTFDEITETYWTFYDDGTCFGTRGGTGVHACNNDGCSAGAKWEEPPPEELPAYDLYVRRMDFVGDVVVGETIELHVTIATDVYPSQGPYFPASYFRWRRGPGFAWQEEFCPADTRYASCTKTVSFWYSQPGEYYVEVEADSRNLVAETDENNNVRGWTVSISSVAAPPATPSGFYVDVYCCYGEGAWQTDWYWDSVPNADYYELWRQFSNDSQLKYFTQTPLTYRDGSGGGIGSSLFPATFAVRACNTAGCSSFASYKVTLPPPPSPTNVQATRDYPYDYLTVTWNASSGATYYRIVTQVCSGEVWNDQTFDGITDTSRTFYDDWTCAGTRGGSGVHACNDSGCSDGVGWEEPPNPPMVY